MTDPDVKQFIPQQYWDNPKFWVMCVTRLLNDLDLLKDFKAGDKLYGVREARDAVQTIFESRKIPHPTIDTINNALEVMSGNVKGRQRTSLPTTTPPG